MTVGVVGRAGAFSTDRLLLAFERLGMAPRLFEAEGFELRGGGVVRYDGEPLPNLQAVVVKKLGATARGMPRLALEALAALASKGLPVYSAPTALAKALSRYRMTRVLMDAGIPMPRTLLTHRRESATGFLEKQGRVVHKPEFSSKARGMLLLDARQADARERLLAVGPPWYLQEFVPGGRDLGIALLGGEVLGGYERIAGKGSWVTSTSAGGRYGPVTVASDLANLARQAAAPFGLVFTVVDLVRHHDGYRVYEVSAFGGFRGLLKGSGIDAAEAIAARVADLLAAAKE